MSRLARHQALVAVDLERDRQEQLKHDGRFAHTCADPELVDHDRLPILLEEVGEVAHALNEGKPVAELRRELVHTAAVAVAWIEALE